MSGIVSNATPLIYLAKIGRIELLRNIWGEVAIPEEVKIEVVDRGKALQERDAYVIEKAIDEGWLKVLRAETVKLPIKLGLGEAAVLSLAKKLRIKDVLMDEVLGRTAAKLLGLQPRGTVYVLLKALERREIDLNEFLEALRQLITCGFRLKEEVYMEAVKEAQRITRET